jgi:hypothetical protein
MFRSFSARRQSGRRAFVQTDPQLSPDRTACDRTGHDFKSSIAPASGKAIRIVHGTTRLFSVAGAR